MDYSFDWDGSEYRGPTGAQSALRVVSILHVIGSFIILARGLPAFLLMLSAGICGIRAADDARKATPCVVLSAAVLVHHIHYTVTSLQRRPPVVMGDLFSPEEVFIFFIAPLMLSIVAWFALSAAAVVLGLIVKKQSEGSGSEPS